MKIGRGRNRVLRRTLQLRDEIYDSLSFSLLLPTFVHLSLSLLRWNIGRYSLLTLALACNRRKSSVLKPSPPPPAPLPLSLHPCPSTLPDVSVLRLRRRPRPIA
ncbi:hypothetical protein EVAR_15965_1 [Eumeta japonica]|uniref:Uncharacterized protein n=1 Tax=Eumeta variegata TaxID=151549 RepID=A0A4C1UMH6_EUMVA|nr:hypothetical protein EVAR_15965_1 [Eumeta japonica]